VVAPYRLAVKDQFGSYVIADLLDFSSTSGDVLFEIYTPYISSQFEQYYEVGQIYKIDNPGLNTRKYSVVSGSFRGDTYLLQRDLYFVEAMSPNDKYWKNWNTDVGRVSSVIRSGGSNLPTSIYYSNQFIQGTEINGLSTFDALDNTNLPLEMKQIQRLVLTTKVGSEGSVLLAIGEQETASVYIGEAQIFDNAGNSFLATTSGVIGSVNVLRGSYGTIHPESAYKWKGEVMFFDANKGCWIRYNVNGLFPISEYKMAKYFKKVGQDIMKYLKDPTEYNLANPNLPIRVLGGVDPFHEEYIASMPRMFLEPKNLVLEDMELSTWSEPFTTVLASLTATPDSMSFSYEQGSGPSASQQFSFTGSNLSVNGTITVTAPANFEVSKDNITFSPSITYPYTGTSASGTGRVRMKAGILGGSVPSATVTISGGGGSDTISVSGTVTVSVTPQLLAIPDHLGAFSYEEGSGPSTPKSFQVVGSSLSPASGDITLTAPANYTISLSQNSGFGPSLTISYTGSALTETVWVRLDGGLPVNFYNLQVISISGGGDTAQVTCSGQVIEQGTTPVITWYPESGYGNSVQQSCSMASGLPVTLYSYDDSLSFGVGSTVYTNKFATVTLLGFTNIFMNGANWDVNPSNGVVIAYSSVQC
jgi:hypothetical protein